MAVQKSCAVCGTTRITDDRFCTTCGSPIDAVAQQVVGPPPAATYDDTLTRWPTRLGDSPEPAPTPQAPRHTGAWILGLVLVALVLVVAGIGVALTLGGDESDPSSAGGAQEAPAPAPASEPTAQEAESESVSETPSEEVTPDATAEPVGDGVLCWDGLDADDVSQCGSPTGLTGLTWLFPSSSNTGCYDVTTTYPQVGRDLLVQCTLVLSDGSLGYLNYSHWLSIADAVSQYGDVEALYRSDEYDADGAVAWLSWSGIQDSGIAEGFDKQVRCYPTVPYCAVGLAEDSSLLTEALDQLEARSADEVSGSPR